MKIFKTLLLVFAPSLLFAQISRNQWLIGGGFSARFQQNSNSSYKQKDIFGYEDVGYFALNRLAVGLRGTQLYKEYFTYIDIYYNPMPVSTKEFSFTGGPFVRYYFFPATSRFNLYSEFYYGYGSTRIKFSSARLGEIKDQSHLFNLNIAPVFMINQHASVQLTAGYYYQTHKNVQFTNLMLGIGLQMHLGKGKTTSQ